MDTAKIITELVSTAKYQERPDVRVVIDTAVAELRGETSKEKIKEVLDVLKEKLSAVLNPVDGSAATPSSDSIKPLDSSDIKDFEKYLTSLQLNDQQKDRLRLLAIGYNDSVLTAQEICPTVTIKPLKKILAEVIKLGPEKLKAIAEFTQPTLLVIPPNRFTDKISSINNNRKYQGQNETYLANSNEQPFQSVASVTETVISIVDGAQHMPHITGIAKDSRWDERRLQFKEHLKQKNLRLINAHEYAVLMQRSLREYQQDGGTDKAKIIDFYENGNNTLTCLDDADLTNSSLVAFGFFYSDLRRVYFHAFDPDFTDEDLRARPSVQVCKY